MGTPRFTDRRDAGRQLASRLSAYAGRADVVVWALPRGGVPVADEVAQALRAPLDICVVRKLGAPGHPEFAFGAIAERQVVQLDDETIRSLSLSGVTMAGIQRQEEEELVRRIALYRPETHRLSGRDRVVILVDDGLATGQTMLAAIASARTEAPAAIVVAVPVASASAMARLAPWVDSCVVCHTPEPFEAVGQHYEAFPQITDAEVIAVLRAASSPVAEAAPGAATPLLSSTRWVLQTLSRTAQRFSHGADDFTALIRSVASAHVILIGEATHGTHEFYQARAELTKRLIMECGVTAIAIEGDWPDAYRVHAFTSGGLSSDQDAADALAGFQRFPQWMWRNADMLDFIGWLRTHNDAVESQTSQVGFFGLDLYSLHASMAAVIDYLATVDPPAAQRARDRYACLEHLSDDPTLYSEAVRLRYARGCEEEVIAQLREMQALAMSASAHHAPSDPAALFSAEQNARIVERAEHYYRGMFRDPAYTWNLRDRHMMSTLRALRDFLERHSAAPPRVVVWAHNSHVGDARVTSMADRGEITLGQLAREAWGEDVVSIGMTTYAGTVTAANRWDGPSMRMTVRPAIPESLEWLLHESGMGDLLLDPRTSPDLHAALAVPRLQRAIGVIYRSDTERDSHYFVAHVAGEFDWLLHLDRTRAVEPLDHAAVHALGELPDTYPSAL